jgi:hypothetical protein
MTEQQRLQAKDLEGRRVSVALRGGARIDDCDLVSMGRGPVDSVWLFVNGADTFVPVGDVVDLWEQQPFRTASPLR